MVTQSLIQWLEKAKKEHWHIPAISVKNISGAQAVMMRLSKNSKPLIVEVVSPKSGHLLDRGELKIDAEIEERATPIFLSCAGINKESDVARAINAGYDLIEWDGRGADYQKTIKVVRRVAKFAHKHHALVEVAMGERAVASNPEQVARFVRETECDLIDVDVLGKTHAVNTVLLKQLQRDVACFLTARTVPEDAGVRTLLSKHGVVKIV